MAVSCPDCGSRFINLARFRSVQERILAISGTRPLRCTDCKTRFAGQTFSLQDLRYAKCPGCYRMDLNVWYEQHLKPHGWMRLKLAFGGTGYAANIAGSILLAYGHAKSTSVLTVGPANRPNARGTVNEFGP